MKIRYTVAAVCLLLLAGTATAATDAQKCAAAKLKAAGKYAACRLGADAKAESSGLAADYSKCDAARQASWTKTEAKYGSACPTSGDDATVQGDVTELSECLDSSLTGTPQTCSLQDLASGVAECTDDLDTCTSDLDTCGAGTASAADVRSGKTFSSAAGVGATGTAAEGADVVGPDGARSVTVPAGFYDGDETVTVQDADLVASNILSGVTILGTTGTYVPPAPPTCGNGTVDPDEDCDLGTLIGVTCENMGYAGGNVSCTSACRRTGCYVRMFVTSEDYDGSLSQVASPPGPGGIQGADDICRMHAYAAGHSGVWRAYISTSAFDARDSLEDGVEYRRMDGTTLIAENRENLAAGLLHDSVGLDEFGDDESAFDYVWTGTKPDGTADARNCNDWTDSSEEVTGVGGMAHGSSSVTWSSVFEHDCEDRHALYCVEGNSATWTPCANEGETCAFDGLKRVRFGILGHYVYLTATGGVTCDVATFGDDPVEGIPKQCEYQ